MGLDRKQVVDLRYEMVGIGCVDHSVAAGFDRNDAPLAGVRAGVGSCPVLGLGHIHNRWADIAVDYECSLDLVLDTTVDRRSRVLEVVAGYGSHVPGRTADHDNRVPDMMVDCMIDVEYDHSHRSMVQKHDFQDTHMGSLGLALAAILALAQQDLGMDVAVPAYSRLVETSPGYSRRWKT